MISTLKPSTVADSNSSRTKSVDDMLLQSIAKGDTRAMERLVVRHNIRVYHYAARLTGNASLAEDIVSEVFLAVWRNAGGFKSRSSVSTWLLAIARNKAVEALRRQREIQLEDEYAATIEDNADSPETNALQTSRRELMQLCLSQLAPAHRELLDLVYYHEKTIAEAAQIIGIPEGTVKSRMAAARQKLAERLRGTGLETFVTC